MLPETDLLPFIEDLYLKKRKIDLINYYQRIPLSFEAQPIDYENGLITFSVHRFQLAASVLAKEVFFMVDGFPNHVWGRVIKTDTNKMIMKVGEFRDAGNSMNRRIFIRVEPDASIPVVLSIFQTQVRAELADISEDGICVYLNAAHLETPDIQHRKSSEHFEIRFLLPDEQYRQIVVKGALRYAVRDSLSGKYKVGFQLFMDNEVKKWLTRYVTRRKKAVLEDLKLLSERVLQGNST